MWAKQKKRRLTEKEIVIIIYGGWQFLLFVYVFYLFSKL